MILAAMLLRLLKGDETEGGTKQPYDPRIHFVLINEAYKAANPGKEPAPSAGCTAGSACGADGAAARPANSNCPLFQA